MYEKGRVQDLDVREDPDTGIITIQALVTSSHENTSYEVRVTLSRNENWIIDSECTCPFYNTYMTPCKHIAAVLLKYIDESKAAIIGNGFHKPVRHTDTAIEKLLNQYVPIQDSAVISQQSSIVLEPTIHGIVNDALEVSFKIYSGTGHKYAIQNIDELCMHIQNHDIKRYGKSLEFLHSLQAFSYRSRPMLQFLMGLSLHADTYTNTSTGYSAYYRYSSFNEQTMKRTLSLKGRYLDEFFAVLGDLAAYMNVPNSFGYDTEVLLNIVDGTPDIHAAITPTEHGYLFKGTALQHAAGHDYLYFMDYIHKRIVRHTLHDSSLLPLLNFLDENPNEDNFISEKDLPAFAKYVYPLVEEHMHLENMGFDPTAYVVQKPNFEIYLDQLPDSTITCGLYAIYKDNKYNVLESLENDGTRDVASEKEMYEFLSPWFNNLLTEKHLLVIFNDDDKVYALLREGIPQMQDKASVFISEKLKKLQIHDMPKYSVGVSVSHDLLQLDLISETMSNKQLAEILSKYDSKKKYYRLKNGDFLNIDDSINELADLKESLSLTSAQISSGSIALPSYRAQYLEELAEENTQFTLEQDQSFHALIEHMHASSSVKHELPSDLHADLRSYQKEGFNWLCALRDNHFSGLLADEMGLGKTLQVIAFLGSWKERERCLVVCPASLVYNWSSEIQRFLPSMHSRIISGSASMRHELITSSDAQEVLITSYDLLKRDIEVYQKMHFSCEVIDEAQYIKNAGTQAARAVKAIDANFKVALTGTPIENRLSELWSIFDYLLPGFFYSYQKFRNNFEVPIIKDNDEDVEQRLRKMITPFVLRRLKKDVLKDLPDKLEEVYYASGEDEQKELYDARVQALKMQLTKQTDQQFKENKLMMLAELTRLRQICCDPSLVYDHYNGPSAKADMCIDMIKNAVEAGHKVLLFSQFTSMLAILTKRLEEEGLAYHLLEGSTPKKQRADMVEAFQKDDVPVFCISLKAGGTGLNLTAADIVIHYDPWWNTAVENQASDRAHRIGQKNVVSVYRLIMKDTIEERILNLQQSKNDLADKILSGEGMSSAKLTREDLLSIL
jgi:SNF2 family DNA or RNA helicase